MTRGVDFNIVWSKLIANTKLIICKKMKIKLRQTKNLRIKLILLDKKRDQKNNLTKGLISRMIPTFVQMCQFGTRF